MLYIYIYLFFVPSFVLFYSFVVIPISLTATIARNISGSQSLFPAFIPLFLAPPQLAPGAIHQAEQIERGEKKTCPIEWGKRVSPPLSRQQGHRRRVYNIQSGGWLQFQSRPALSLSLGYSGQTAATYYIHTFRCGSPWWPCRITNVHDYSFPTLFLYLKEGLDTFLFLFRAQLNPHRWFNLFFLATDPDVLYGSCTDDPTNSSGRLI